MAFVVAQEVPTSSTMAVSHGPAGVGEARRRMQAELRAGGASESIIDDAVLVLSELLSNSCRHARPLGTAESFSQEPLPVTPWDYIRAAWSRGPDGDVTVSVTDGGGPTRPLPATPSVTARGGRGLAIVTHLCQDWGVTEEGTSGRVTVWALLSPTPRFSEVGRARTQRRPALDLVEFDDFV